MCDDRYPGTREGFILVVDITPKIADETAPAARDGDRTARDGDRTAPDGDRTARNGDRTARNGDRTARDGDRTARNGDRTAPDGDRTARNAERRRAELADFLRRRRESISPEDVGLPSGGRRRTPGLRREEVAQLSGVGTTWYTWLEQGRDVRASLEVLEAVSRALRLTPAERTHLLLLGRGEDPPPCKSPRERVSPTLRRLIENLGPNPAYVIGRRWDYLAWNRAACVLLGDLDRVPRSQRNHVWLHFMDPVRRELFTDWVQGSRLLVAKFRADSAHHLGDPDFEQLIHALRQSSPEFCREWKRHEVSRTGPGRKELIHQVVGTMVFEHAVLHPGDAPDQRLVLYSPLPDHDTPAKLAQLMEREPQPVVA